MNKKIAHNAIDMSGQRFGSLTVDKRNGISTTRKAIWLCKCDCGNEKNFTRDDLLTGRVKSCGCIHKLKPSSSYYNFSGYMDMSGHSYYRIKRRAEKSNIEFSVSIEYIYNLFISQNKKCALSGQDIEISALKGKKQTASLDRIDSSKGYIEGNVQWLHIDINLMKLDHPQDKFIELCRLVVKNVET